MAEKLPATTLVILGVSGDLSQRYLLPALAEICQSSEVRARLNILGVSRRRLDAKEALPAKAAGLADRFEVLRMDYGQAGEYKKLKDKLERLGAEQVIFYFAVPPQAVLPIIRCLGSSGLNASKYRLLMEKPFGTDLASARQLIKEISEHFKEEQVYRIDHYLAKEMAQNLTVFLGSNAIFRDVWNGQFIEKIEIAAEEHIGIEKRAEFWEQTGTLRDFVQSHLMQLAALVLMEPCPDVFDFSMVRGRRLEALRDLQLDNSKPVIKGQYQDYRQEVGNPDSQTETFVSLVLESANLKWKGVPIRLTTGKKLKEKLTEIRVYFKKTQSAQTNLLRLRIQPREAIELELWVKKPGYEQDLQKLPLDFSYQQHFRHLPDAYEQVIVDAIRSRSNLFASSDEVLASWETLQPLIDKWDEHKLTIYKPGQTADAIIQNT
jgi:glucose-6-phosphate 1-dehydrogenase